VEVDDATVAKMRAAFEKLDIKRLEEEAARR
jgi:hypothetical protein